MTPPFLDLKILLCKDLCKNQKIFFIEIFVLQKEEKSDLKEVIIPNHETIKNERKRCRIRKIRKF